MKTLTKLFRSAPLLAIAGLSYGLWLTPIQAQAPAEAAPPAPATEAEAEPAAPTAVEAAPVEEVDGEVEAAPTVAPPATGKVVITDAMVEKLSAQQLQKVLLRANTDQADAGDIEGIVVPIFFFFLLAFVVAVPLYLGYRKDQLRQGTLRLMVEKGAEIPPELLTPPVKRRRSDLRTGLILISAGLGLMIFLGAVATADSPGIWSVGAVPALVGFGYLAAWKLEAGKNDPGAPR